MPGRGSGRSPGRVNDPASSSGRVSGILAFQSPVMAGEVLGENCDDLGSSTKDVITAETRLGHFPVERLGQDLGQFSCFTRLGNRGVLDGFLSLPCKGKLGKTGPQNVLKLDNLD